MRDLKLTYFWVFLIVFLSGKAHSVISPFLTNTIHKHQQKEFKPAQKIISDTGDENSPAKRKIKKRGLPRAVPEIENITFISVLIHKTFNPVYTETFYTSFLYCVSQKRGPPFA